MVAKEAARRLLHAATALLLSAVPLIAQQPNPLGFLAAAENSAARATDQSDQSGAARKKASKLVDAKQDNAGAGRWHFSFRFRNRPELQIGKWLVVDFRTKIHADFRMFDPEIHHQNDGALFNLRRMRVSVEGTAFKVFEYSVERDIRQEVGGDDFSSRHPWKDVFVNFRYFRGVQVQVGHFKLPFGLEENTSSSHMDFIYRSVATDTLTPGRDTGILLHSRLLERAIHYEVGLFLHDGEKARGKNDIIAGYRTFAGRLTGTPLRLFHLPGFLRGVEVGGAFTESAVPGIDGVYGGLRARTYSKQTWFPDMFVHGHRLRLGAEFKWMPGPFSLKSEFIHVRDQRLGQGLMGEDLPDLIARGWYVSGTWLVTGEKKADTVVPRRTVIPFHGLGAFEIATRYDQTRMGSSEHPGRPSRNSRAANIIGNRDFGWTFGANWYWNRFVRIQFNAMRERLEDPTRSPFGDTLPFWAKVWQLQFVL